ncbi:MAG TPA: phosphatase PAP2 family protein [Chthoniobacteraceae bacterium]|jgi:undecaprenyl-diphosphatase
MRADPDSSKIADAAEAALEHGIADVRTPAEADRTIRELEIAAADTPPAVPENATELARATAEQRDTTAAKAVAAAAVEVARATDKEAERLDQAVANTTGTTAEHIPADDSRALQRGRRLLRKALVRRLRPLDAVDAIFFLRINRLPHPAVADRVMTTFTNVMHRGDGYLMLLALLFLRDRKRGWKAIKGVVPILWLATATVEFPIKHFFRRRRPFLSIIRAIIVGKKPASYSFPSGHSAAAFAGAELLARHYPKRGRLFRAIAALVGFSRVYLGAHYPGDVIIGALSGIFFARLYRRIFIGKK